MFNAFLCVSSSCLFLLLPDAGCAWFVGLRFVLAVCLCDLLGFMLWLVGLLAVSLLGLFGFGCWLLVVSFLVCGFILVCGVG